MDDPLQKLDNLISSLKRNPEERRLQSRAKSVKRAKIVYGDKPSTMTCYITDLSQTGARLRPSDPSRLPDTFTIQLAHDLMLRCEIVRQQDGTVGVRFLF